MKVDVTTRSGKIIGSYDLPDDAHLSDLQKAIHKSHPKYYPERQRLYASPPPDAGGRPAPLSGDHALTDGDQLLFKDLGPQILWKTVFVLEYLGPLLLYPLFYSRPGFIYGDASNAPRSEWASLVQLYALVAWSVHYAKRELETVFVHRFSNATMPFSNLFKNCGYYWGFAAWVAYFVNHPLFTPPGPEFVYGGMLIFYLMQLGNFMCHMTLRGLRPAGSRVRRIPFGGLFEFVSCPNYFFEIMAWVGFNFMTKTAAGMLFMTAGAVQMAIWAQGKHRRYIKEFDGKDGRDLYPNNRKMIVPYIY